jgi:hypothetical protein
MDNGGLFNVSPCSRSHTSDEHAVLADWFRTKPPGFAQEILPEDAAKRLGRASRLFSKCPAAIDLNHWCDTKRD